MEFDTYNSMHQYFINSKVKKFTLFFITSVIMKYHVVLISKYQIVNDYFRKLVASYISNYHMKSYCTLHMRPRGQKLSGFGA